MGNPIGYTRYRPNRDYLWINAAGLFQPLGDHMGTECAWLAWDGVRVGGVAGVACHRQLVPWQGQPQFRVPRHLQTSITSCLTFPIGKMSPAFLRPPKTKIRGLGLKYFSGQLISALPSKLFQSSGSTTRCTPRLPEEHWDWEALPSTPLAPLAPHTDLAPRAIALFHLKFLKKKFIFPR